MSAIELSHEQQEMYNAVLSGHHVRVDATVGSGKTTAIQRVCDDLALNDKTVLYLTFSSLLKKEARRRLPPMDEIEVHSYHSLGVKYLHRIGEFSSVATAVQDFVSWWDRIRPAFAVPDVLIIDEYQDMNGEYAEMVERVASTNPDLQVVMVGDMDQQVRDASRFDVSAFIDRTWPGMVDMDFTQSFRIGPEIADQLSIGWDKTVQGTNTEQTVSYLSFDEAVRKVGQYDPSQLILLGQRNGAMAHMLNIMEEVYPVNFNKDTVYASIRDSDDGKGVINEDVGICTTFDSSKGMERPVALIFDFDPDYYKMRLSKNGTDPVIMRNIMLVGASRGKNEVVFVQGRGRKKFEHQHGQLGFIDMPALAEPGPTQPWDLAEPLAPSQCFEHRYTEDVTTALGCLDATRISGGEDEVIDFDRTDGLIDLSPAVGNYQEALFFDDYDAHAELDKYPSAQAGRFRDLLGEDDWRNALVLAACDTHQMRYVTQVEARVPETAQEMIRQRLFSVLRPSDPHQVHVSRGFTAADGQRGEFFGVMDAVSADDVVYELKFVSELSATHFLQAGLYAVLRGTDEAVLWNVRDNSRWMVRVPDPQRFCDAAITCISKGAYQHIVLDEMC